MRAPDAAIEKADLRIARAQSDSLFLGRDERLDQSGHELAPAEVRVCVRPVAIECDRGLVLGNRLVVPVLRAQNLGHGETRDRVAWRYGQSALGQIFRARDVGGYRVGHKIEGAGGKLDRQPTLRPY